MPAVWEQSALLGWYEIFKREMKININQYCDYSIFCLLLNKQQLSSLPAGQRRLRHFRTGLPVFPGSGFMQLQWHKAGYLYCSAVQIGALPHPGGLTGGSALLPPTSCVHRTISESERKGGVCRWIIAYRQICLLSSFLLQLSLTSLHLLLEQDKLRVWLVWLLTGDIGNTVNVNKRWNKALVAACTLH